MKFYIDGKKVPRKSVLEAVGAESMRFIENESRSAHADDPLDQISFTIHYKRTTKILNVSFE